MESTCFTSRSFSSFQRNLRKTIKNFINSSVIRFGFLSLISQKSSKKMKKYKNIRWMMMIMITVMEMILMAKAADTNDAYSPCMDAKVQRMDGFTLGLAFSAKESFFLDNVQLSPCDNRLALPAKMAKLAVFRPYVDEISLLTINSTDFNPEASGGQMVAFAGRKYAARSLPVMVADLNNMIITSFTLVLEFQKGTLNNLYWKSSGCFSCSKEFVCIDGKDCAIPSSKCTNNGGPIDCSLGIQLTFSGTDKNLESLNSWYEVSNLRRHSLYGLYSGFVDQFAKPF